MATGSIFNPFRHGVSSVGDNAITTSVGSVSGSINIWQLTDGNRSFFPLSKRVTIVSLLVIGAVGYWYASSKKPSSDLSVEISSGNANVTNAVSGDNNGGTILQLGNNSSVTLNEVSAQKKVAGNQVKAAPDGFVSREREITTIQKIVQNKGTVSIIAHGGMGKTALTQKALGDFPNIETLYPDGIIFCDFYLIASMESIEHILASPVESMIEHILNSLGEKRRQEENMFNALRRVLGKRQVLLVLDGTEKIRDHSKNPQLQDLLNATAQSGVVITSRDARDSRGEVINLIPLSKEDGGRYLASVSKQRNTQEFEELSRFLGGVPLAIHLVGSYLEATGESPESYLNWSQDNLDKALSEEHSVDSKYQTLDRMMEKSIEKVAPNAKSLLAILGQLALDFVSKELLERATGKPGRKILKNLGELKRYGLIVQEGERSRLLHPLLYTYANSTLEVDVQMLRNIIGYFEQSSRKEQKSEWLHLESAHVWVLAVNLFDTGLLPEAAQLYKLAADQGLAWAQFNLGLCYGTGKGVPKDEREAVRLFKLAADQGYALAQFNLGVSYEEGKGVAKDLSEAAQLYKLSADQGFAEAQYNLGVSYEEGKGVAKDESEAVRLYKLAADQGYALAQVNLGVCYENGKGVTKNESEAVRLYKLSADQGYALAQFNLGECYYHGKGVPKDQREAERLFMLAADQGDPLLQHVLHVPKN